jgi:hypothetical protein
MSLIEGQSDVGWAFLMKVHLLRDSDS